MNRYTEGSTRVLDVADDKDVDDDDDGDGGDVDVEDDVVPPVVREIPFFSRSIIPVDGFWRLGFFLDEFMESLFTPPPDLFP